MDATAAADRVIEQPEAYLNRIATNLLRDRAKTALQR
ncbi:MAG: DNA-directed RNA polymerase specialized sigma24 family protein, partial [Sphingomonas echinoides]